MKKAAPTGYFSTGGEMRARGGSSTIRRLKFRRFLLWVWIFAPFIWAQPITVTPPPSLEIYSEFQRIDPFGKVVPADRSTRSREVLSPAVPRNAFASFHIAVSLPRDESYFLYVAPNPANACDIYVYRERFLETDQGWIPDTLVKLDRLPDFGVIPDPSESIPGQNTRLYLLDVRIRPNTTVQRIRLEVQLKIGYFLVRPIEIRVLDLKVPELKDTPDTSPPTEPATARSDTFALETLRNFFLTGQATEPLDSADIRAIIKRNAVQDIALAISRNPTHGVPYVMKKTMQGILRSAGPEWYLQFREYLYRNWLRH